MSNLHILLVEDNIHDVAFIQAALNTSTLTSVVDVVNDGAECVDLLNKVGKHANATKPDIIILDLNMPVLDGIEVLKQIKQDPSHKRIPIVVFTSSKDVGDIRSAYDNYVNSYVVKPMDPQQYENVVKEIEKFWMTISEIP